LIIWDLEFTVKSYLWPAVEEPGGIIGSYSTTSGRYGQANTNIYINTQNRDAQKLYVDYQNGNNYYTIGETVRANGSSYYTGKVIYFSNNTNGILIVGELNGLFSPNNVITGDYSGATYTVTRTDVTPLKAVHIVTTAVPQDSAPDDHFGFNDEFTEWPNTLL